MAIKSNWIRRFPAWINLPRSAVSFFLKSRRKGNAELRKRARISLHAKCRKHAFHGMHKSTRIFCLFVVLPIFNDLGDTGVGRIFFRRGGAIVDLSRSSQNVFSRGGQKWLVSFFPLETKKITFFDIGRCKISKSRGKGPLHPPSNAHAWWAVCRKNWTGCEAKCGRTKNIQNKKKKHSIIQNYMDCKSRQT